MPRKKKERPDLDLEVYTKSGKLRKRKRKQSRNYFTQQTEDAIVEYLSSTCHERRNFLFNTHINYSLHKLAENIINTFKFYYMEVDSIDDLKHEVVAFLLQKLHKYDQTKGKAFSYFGKVTKTYLIIYNEANYKKLKQKADLDEVDEDKRVYAQITSESAGTDLIVFMESFIKYFKANMDTIFPDEKDLDIAYALLEVFKRRENLQVDNKQKLYLYLREITNQPSQNITRVVKQFKEIYKEQMNVYYLQGELDI